MWTLRYDPRVRKQLEKIRNKALIRRIKESAETLQENPFAGKPLRGYPGVRSKRSGTPEGEYRLIYVSIEDKQEVFIILVGSRNEVYGLLERKKI
jgi:mRNA-degrading endonuclease RelE of RelBE toxin-antitoxin system